ncbi:hypothetical protein HanXRQr2_Chr01g0006811 [Helianthus annuus]|uniref:Uncharacterized protein n=1 Tax=Helianthus annuus TaxID=4232 RepID=A0A251VKM2_HELAN|nr:hypothetical protein HanXRQr2_Chr01g0006811 [Helianthus annuus]KAJ0610594.1 hypothetical protein HanHA300_Chr01g0005501 [Helianthus annuus]KAJ0621341.1 hypothetical protein HanIR_Chr01g0007551 [Helianthus annuus]KAJ0625845.1 hypothetical protein HanHA89_Chr01g0006201 [Helianthus annuus]KAJ0829071.1 hypothetical protein HanLR1_Chr00c0042g0698621 [Helianthus annuus]
MGFTAATAATMGEQGDGISAAYTHSFTDHRKSTCMVLFRTHVRVPNGVWHRAYVLSIKRFQTQHVDGRRSYQLLCDIPKLRRS